MPTYADFRFKTKLFLIRGGPLLAVLSEWGESMFRFMLVVLFLPFMASAKIDDFNDILDRAEVDHLEIAEKVEQARKASAVESREDKMIRIMDEKGQERVLASAKVEPLKKRPSVKKNKTAKKAAIAKIKSSKINKMDKIKKVTAVSKYKKRKPSHVQKERTAKPKQQKRNNKSIQDRSAMIAAP